LHEGKLAAGCPDGGELDPYRFGVETCRPTLEIIIDFCHQQNSPRTESSGRQRSLGRGQFRSVIVTGEKMTVDVHRDSNR